MTRHGNFGRWFDPRPAAVQRITDDEITLNHGAVAPRLQQQDDVGQRPTKLYLLPLKPGAFFLELVSCIESQN